MEKTININIQPSNEQIEQWIRSYVPEKDFYFLKEEDLSYFADELKSVLVIPREEFHNHSTYSQIHLVNSYEYWNISREAGYVVVSHSDWTSGLTPEKKRILFTTQVKMNRGLILPISAFNNPNAIPVDNIVEDQNGNFLVVLHYDMWGNLPFNIKEQAIVSYAREWDSWNCSDIPEQTPSHIKKFANIFPIEAGCNCLSSVLFAITEQEWIIKEWVHPQTFLKGLENANYHITQDSMSDGDVITWEDEAGNIQHASYYLGNHLFFNKNGQTYFNPWRIVDWDELREKWDYLKIKAFRKREDSVHD